MLTFTVGIASIALLLGFLVGASDSPVAGVALTATFGIAAAALSLYQKSEAGDPSDRSADEPKKTTAARRNTIDTLNLVGRMFVVFSFAFFVGLICGVYVKLLPSAVEPASPFPWQGLGSPTSARIAIDWILVQRHLKSVGYSDIQITDLYKIYLQQDKNIPRFSSNDSDLLSPLFLLQKSAQGPTPRIAERGDPPGSPRFPGLFGQPG